jgi:hypothetical protein
MLKKTCPEYLPHQWFNFLHMSYYFLKCFTYSAFIISYLQDIICIWRNFINCFVNYLSSALTIMHS